MIIQLHCSTTIVFNILVAWAAFAYKAEQIIRRGPGQDLQCADPLIKSVDKFPDNAFSSSSVWKNASDFQPYRARLTEVYGSKEHTSGYAWCPHADVNDSLREWIQAEFPHLVMITTIFTAGRGDGNVKEFMPGFVLRYQREVNGTWYEHVKSNGDRVLKANNDPRNLARVTLDSIIVAKRIRIYPYSHRASQQVCVRFALYGCDFPDGVVSYTIPQGDTTAHGQAVFSSTNPFPYSFRDFTYDGQQQQIGITDLLISGLGQLMDNVAYLGNVTTYPDLHPTQPGYHFVGWKKSSGKFTQNGLEMLFKFDQVRNFTWLRLFTFDSVTMNARKFARAKIAVSLDGVYYGNSLEYHTGRARLVDPEQTSDSGNLKYSRSRYNPTHMNHEVVIYTRTEWDGALAIQLPLNYQIGRFIRLNLVPTDEWMFISEIQFNSTIVTSLPNPNMPKMADELSPITLKHDDLIPSGQLISNKEDQLENINGIANLQYLYPAREISNKQAIAGTNVDTQIVSGNTDLPISKTIFEKSDLLPPSRKQNLISQNVNLSDHKSYDSLTNIAAIIAYILVALFSLCLLITFVSFIHKRRLCTKRKRHCKKLGSQTGTHPIISGNLYSPNSGLGYNAPVPEASKLLRTYPTNCLSNARSEQENLSNNLQPVNMLQFAGNTNTNSDSVTSPNNNNNNNNSNNNINNASFLANATGLCYPISQQILNPTSNLLPCAVSTNCINTHLNGEREGVTTNPNIAISTQSNFMSSTLSRGSNVYVGSDLASVGGMTNIQQSCYTPTFIVLPNSATAVAGLVDSGYLLQRIDLVNPDLMTTISRMTSSNLIGTPDSGSLYTSIRNSVFQATLNSSMMSGGDSEPIDKESSPLSENRKLTLSKNDCPDTDEDVTELKEEIADINSTEPAEGALENNVKSFKSARSKRDYSAADMVCVTSAASDLKQGCVGPPEVSDNLPNEQRVKASVTSENLTLSRNHSPPNKSRHRPVSHQFSFTSASHYRNSIHSLPDGEETQAYMSNPNYYLYKPRSFTSRDAAIPLHLLQGSSPYFILHPLGPEYASASIFGFTPPPSEPPSNEIPATNSPTSVPASLYRPLTPPFVYPLPGLAAGLGTIYTGPASLPISPPSFNLHPTNLSHIRPNLNQASGGLFFLPQSSIGLSHMNQIPLTNNFNLMNVSRGFPQAIPPHPYHIYQTSRILTPTPTAATVTSGSVGMQQQTDQRSCKNSNDSWNSNRDSSSIGRELSQQDNNLFGPESMWQFSNYDGTLRNQISINPNTFHFNTTGMNSQSNHERLSLNNHFTNQLIYPQIPRNSANLSDLGINFPRSSPVGAAVAVGNIPYVLNSNNNINNNNNNSNNDHNNTTTTNNNNGESNTISNNNIINSNTLTPKDGTNSGRLSLYSVCI